MCVEERAVPNHEILSTLGNLVRKIVKDYMLIQHELYVIPLTLQTLNPFWQLKFCAFVAALVWYSRSSLKGPPCWWGTLWFSQLSLGSFITISQLSELWKPVSGKQEHCVYWSQWNVISHREKAGILKGHALQVCCRWSKVLQECCCKRGARFTLHATGCKSHTWITCWCYMTGFVLVSLQSCLCKRCFFIFFV